MADTKITGFTEDTSPTSDDAVVVVDDSGGTPVNKRVSLSNLYKAMGCTLLFSGTDPSGSVSSGSESFRPMCGRITSVYAIESKAQVPMLRAGTISNFMMGCSVNSMDEDAVFTIRKNGVDTAVTVTIPAASTGGHYDTTHSFTVVQGDLIALKCDTTSATTGSYSGPCTSLELRYS